MIKRLTISNYRSIGDDVRIDMAPLTVLVGPNGSGKSNVADSLRFVRDSLVMGLPGAITSRHGISAVRRWSRGHPRNVSIRLDLVLADGSLGAYEFELRGDSKEEYRVKSEFAEIVVAGERHAYRVTEGRWAEGPQGLSPQIDATALALPSIAGDARFRELANALRGMSIYSIFPDTLRRPQPYSPEKPLDTHGQNWASILREQDESSWKPELVAALRSLTGDIEDLRIKNAEGFLVVAFKHSASSEPETNGRGRPKRSPDKWFAANQESDGTLRVAGIVTALLQEPPLPTIGIEEPELTVHPGAIPLLYDFLIQASRRSQVVVSTHSPELLDLVDAEAVRVVNRTADGTTVARMADEQRQVVRGGLMSLGDILRTEGLQQDLAFQDDGHT